MQINTDKLITVTNFAKQKGISRQHAYRIINSGQVNSVNIDGVLFVIVDEKFEKLITKSF